MRVNVIIPTYKPDEGFIELIQRLNKQTVKPDKIIVMNTEEELYIKDNPSEEAFNNVEVHHLSKLEFDHGHTRNEGMSYATDADVCILMTMDAIPADNYMIEELVKALDGENVATAYARQMAYEHSSDIERMTREFNYPPESSIKSQCDIERLQIKALFCSNVCCAYKKTIFDELGGFVDKTIFNEDMLFAYKVLKAGYRIAYCAEAKVYHSHEYTGIQQFHRNFDNGVSHAQYPEVFEGIKAEGEGIKMVKTCLKVLCRKAHFIKAIQYIWATGCKLIGYKLGCRYEKLPIKFVLWATSDRSYFE